VTNAQEGGAARGPEAARWPPVQYYVKITVAVLLVLLTAYLIYRARSALVLIFLACLLAVGLEPVIQRLERRGIRRGFCVLGFAVLIAGALTALAFLVIAPAAQEVSGFASSVPDLLNNLQKHLQGTSLGGYLKQNDVRTKIQQGISSLLENSVSGVLGVLGGAISTVFTAVTLLILTIYFMLALPRLRRSLDRMLRTRERQDIAEEALSRVGGYVSGQLLICVCAGISAYIALTLIGAPFPALLAIIITVLDAIPQVGATIGAVIAVLAALTASIPVAIATLVFLLLYQQLENYLIAPRIFARTVELTPLASLLSVLIGATLFGVVGAIAALPVTAAGSVILRSTQAARRLGKDQPDPADPPVPREGPGPAGPGPEGPGPAGPPAA
jgi:predicted PurR-regulated permease PerM